MGYLFFRVAINSAHFIALQCSSCLTTAKLFRCSMASNIWRPVDFEDDAHSKRVQEDICQLIVGNIHGDMIYKCVSLTCSFFLFFFNLFLIEPPKKKMRRCKAIEAEEEIVFSVL